MQLHRAPASTHTGRDPSRAMWGLVLVACVLTLAACGSRETASIGFGTGGVDCELEATASSLPAGTTVRVIARFHPLPSAVTVTATKDGSPLRDPDTVTLDGSVPCMYGRVPDVEPGRYEFVVAHPGSQMPPLIGSFEVTP